MANTLQVARRAPSNKGAYWIGRQEIATRPIAAPRAHEHDLPHPPSFGADWTGAKGNGKGIQARHRHAESHKVLDLAAPPIAEGLTNRGADWVRPPEAQARLNKLLSIHAKAHGELEELMGVKANPTKGARASEGFRPSGF